MAPFRFRAGAALDLRRQQEHDAAAALARAEARFHEAQEVCAATEAQRAKAQADQQAQAERGIDVATLFWHRNWITRLQATVDDLRADVRAKAQAVDKAGHEWRLARRRRMALDRMRERALARHGAEEQRQELKVIDELARIRFTMSEADEGGRHDGN
jgi:flagellar export protein FliJ